MESLSNRQLEYIERTREARNHSGKKQDEVADYIGVARNTYTNYELRRTMPQKYIARFCEATGVTEKWLLTGEGPMTPDIEDEKKDKLWKLYLEADDNLRKMINAGLGLEE